jgi:hypothetical protein
MMVMRRSSGLIGRHWPGTDIELIESGSLERREKNQFKYNFRAILFR